MTSTVKGFTKTCCCCRQDLPIESFAIKVPAKGTRQSRCRVCAKEASRAHYLANKQALIAKARDAREAQKGVARQLVADLLADKACCKCGSTSSLTFKRDAEYTGPRVSAAVNAGMALATVREAVRNSTVYCKPCEAKAHTSLGRFMAAKKAGQEFIGSPLTRAQQKALNTRSPKDLRRNRFEEGRLLEASTSAVA